LPQLQLISSSSDFGFQNSSCASSNPEHSFASFHGFNDFLESSYLHQIPIKEQNKSITAFATLNRVQLEYNVMPMNLTNSPCILQVFQRCINIMLDHLRLDHLQQELQGAPATSGRNVLQSCQFEAENEEVPTPDTAFDSLNETLYIEV
jgi:hypothetical protein